MYFNLVNLFFIYEQVKSRIANFYILLVSIKLYDFKIYYFVFSKLHMRRGFNTVQALLQEGAHDSISR